MQLRPYQSEAVESIYDYLIKNQGNPCVVIPTGGGKTPILATLCRDVVQRWGGRVIVLAHVKELLEQVVDKLNAVAPDLDVGVYSAGLSRRDTDHSVIVAGIQSIYKRASIIGPADLIIIDECHLLPPEGQGRYRRFIKEAQSLSPHLRVVGLTATPFRTSTGHLCGKDQLLEAVCYEVGVKDLVDQGYLCPLFTKVSRTEVDTDAISVRGGEFASAEMEAAMDQAALVRSACEETVTLTRDRHACLIFVAGVKHAESIAREMRNKHRCDVGTIFGDTLPEIRAQTIDDFKAGRLKYLVNVNADHGLRRSARRRGGQGRVTMSPGLWYQCTGRGLRLHPSKQDCLVLDFFGGGGNILRHGPINDLRIKDKGDGDGVERVKVCPRCLTRRPWRSCHARAAATRSR